MEHTPDWEAVLAIDPTNRLVLALIDGRDWIPVERFTGEAIGSATDTITDHEAVSGQHHTMRSGSARSTTMTPEVSIMNLSHTTRYTSRPTFWPLSLNLLLKFTLHRR